MRWRGKPRLDLEGSHSGGLMIFRLRLYCLHLFLEDPSKLFRFYVTASEEEHNFASG